MFTQEQDEILNLSFYYTLLVCSVLLFALALSGCGGGGKKNESPTASFTASTISGEADYQLNYLRGSK